MGRIFGSYEESYALVPELCRQLHVVNEGNIAKYSMNNMTETFTGLGVAFKACIYGFVNGCRPLVGIDGCHLK